MGGDGFRHNADFHTLERCSGINEPLKFRFLFFAAERRELDLFIEECARGIQVGEGRD